MTDFELHTFGALWVERRHRARPVFHGGNACRLLVMLATNAESGSRRATLARLLWPHATEDKRQHSLRQLLCNIRRRLASDAIEESSEVLRLPADRWWVDFTEFEKAVREARWRDAAALYGGRFAGELDREDALELSARLDALGARLHVKATHCFVQLIFRALVAGDRSGAERWARAFVALDPVGPYGLAGDIRKAVDPIERTGPRRRPREALARVTPGP